MADIGNAVGKITIDSSGVVAGVEAAQKALSGLDAAADKAMAGLAAAIEKGGDAAQAAADKMRGAVDKIGDGFRHLQAAASRAMDMMATAVKGGLLAAGAGFAAAAGAGLEFNSSMEQVEAQLTAFLKDGDKVANTLEMIETRAASTPFAFEEMAAAAAGLVPAANQSGQSLEKLIETAEILAASNPAEGLEGAAFALREAVSGDFASIIERFNLPRQRINELREQGIPALEAVGTAMRELGLDSELVTNMANTAVGRWSTIQDTLVGIAASLTQPIFDAVSAGAGQFIEVLERLRPTIDAIVVAVSAFVENLVNGQSVVQSLQTAVVQIAEALGFTRTEALNAGLELANLVESLQATWQWFTDLVEPITAFVTKFVELNDVLVVVGGIIAGVVVSALASLAAAAAPVLIVFGALVLAVATLRTAWEENFAGIQELVAGLWEGLQLAFDGVKQLLEGDLTGAMETFRAAWETGWTAVVEFVGNLWTLVEGHLVSLWESIKSWFDSQDWQAIGATVSTSVAAGLATFETAATTKLAEWQQIFLNWAQADSWTQIGNDFVTLIQAGAGVKFGEFETSIFQNGVELVGKLLDGLATFTTTALTTFAGWTNALAGWVSGYDWSQLGYDVTNAIIEGLKGFVALVAGAGGVLETWRQGFVMWAMNIENWKALGKAVVDGIVAGWKFTATVKNAINQFFTGVIKAVREALGMGTGQPVMLKTAQDAVFDFVKGAESKISDVVSIGQSIVEGLRSGIEGKIKEVAEWGARMVRAVIDAARGAAQSHSPSRVTMALGSDMGEGTRIGVEQSMGGLRAAGAGMANAVAGGFSAMAGVGGGAMDHLDSLMNAIRAGVAAFGDLTEQTKAYVELLNSVIGVFKEAVGLIQTLQGVTNGTSVEPAVLWINHQLLVMARAIQAGANAFGGQMTAQTKPYMELVNAAVSTFKEAVGAIQTLQGVTNGTSVEPAVLWINHQLLVMARAIQAGANAFGEVAANTKAYIELIKEIISLVADGVAALAAIGSFVPVDDAAAKIAVFVEQVLDLTRQFAGGIAKLGDEVVEHIQIAAELSPLVKDLLDVVKTAVDALAAISKFVAVENLKQQLAAFVGQTVALLGSFASGLAGINSRVVGQIEVAVELSPLVKELLGIVKTAVDALAAISKFVAVENLKQKLADFGSSLVSVVASMSQWFTKFNERIQANMTAAAGMAGDVKELLGIVKTAVDALTAIGAFVAVENLRERMDTFANQLVLAVASMAFWFTKFNERIQANMTAAAGMAGDVKELLGVVKTAVDSLKAINEFVGVTQLEEKIELFMHQLVRTVAFMARRLVEGLAGLEESLATAGNLSGLAKDVLETVKRGVDSLAALNEFVGVTQLEEKIELFMHQLVRTVAFMARRLVEGLAGLEESLATAGNLSGLAKDVLESVKRGVDSLLALNDFVGVDNLEATLSLFGQQLVRTVIALTTGLNAGLAGMEAGLTSAGNLSGLAKDVLETVKRGVDSLLALAEFTGVASLSSTLDAFVAQLVYTVQRLTAGLNAGLAGMEESLASAGNLSGLAKDVLESVKRGVDSLTALGEFKPVEDLANTLAAFSAQFISAVKIVTNTLNNIATTVGQGALDSAASIAGTVKGISDSVLASIRSINSLADSEEPKSLQGIMDKLASAIGVRIPNIAANGLSGLVAAITEQLAALPIAFQNAGVLAADSLANALISSIPALQSLATSIGIMISNEIAAGILANQATIAQAITVVAGAGAAGVGTPPPGGDTINNTSVNMFGGQSFGSSSSPRSITDEFSRLR